MNPIEDSTKFGNLKKQLTQLNRSQDKQSLHAPLPDVVTKRMTRKMAYDISSEKLKEWKDFVSRYRSGTPMQFPLPTERVNVSQNSLVETFEPQTSFENEIDAILKESGIHPTQLQKGNELPINEVTEDEVRERMAEMIKMRNVLFYQQQKAKRQKKIKSKSYHRVLRKQKEKQKLTLEELRELDPEAAQLEEEKLELERIRERMTGRHGKTRSKLKGVAKKDLNTRKVIQEKLEYRQKLLKKIQQEDSESESDEEENESDDEEEEEEKPKSTVHQMKFMQDGAKRDLEEYRDGLKARMGIEDDDEEEDLDVELTHAEILKKGKKQPKAQDGTNESEDEDVQVDERGMLVKKNSHVTRTKRPVTVHVSQPLVQFETEQFPDDVPDFLDPVVQKTTKKGTTSTANGVANGTKKTNKVEKQKSREDEDLKELQEIKEDLRKKIVPDSQNPWLQEPAKVSSSSQKTRESKEKQKQEKKTKGKASKVQDIDPEKAILLSKDLLDTKQKFNLLGSATAEQKKLIEEAFYTGDSAGKEFEEEKAKVLDKDLPKEEDDSLPGWGEWSGSGTKARPKKVKPAPKRPKRSDDRLAKVILHQKMPKASQRYVVKDLPHGFVSADHYEQVMRNPMGKEWQSSLGHLQLTEPKVRVRRGAIIDPIQKSTAESYMMNLVKLCQSITYPIRIARKKFDNAKKKESARFIIPMSRRKEEETDCKQH